MARIPSYPRIDDRFPIQDPVCVVHKTEHQFAIPVEWDYKNAGGILTSKSASKLRCACGEEMYRIS